MTQPKVTVFIGVFNGEQFIGETIESVLSQSFSDFEVLVVDDASPDCSVEIVESIPDPRIRLSRNEHNLGIPRTRNRGLELAEGEYLAILDSDDLAHPRRLEAQVAFLDRHPDHVQVGSWCRFMDAEARPLKKTKRYPLATEDIRAQLLFRCCMKNSTITGRTEVLRKFGYRNEFMRCQDYDLHVRLARYHKIANIPLVLAQARQHSGRFTGKTVELGDQKKRQIVSEQLDELGVDYTESDLVSHGRLSRMERLNYVPDGEYLDWSEQWLCSLWAANARARVHPPPVFARVLCEKWIQVCYIALRGSAGAIRQRFVRSPLMRGAAGRVRQYVSEEAQQHRAHS